MIEASQYSADEKVFYGSEFPMQTPDQNKEALFRICSFGEGANFPQISKEVVERIMTRDVYGLLGIA
jgi:hypothetical protein